MEGGKDGAHGFRCSRRKIRHTQRNTFHCGIRWCEEQVFCPFLCLILDEKRLRRQNRELFYALIGKIGIAKAAQQRFFIAGDAENALAVRDIIVLPISGTGKRSIIPNLRYIYRIYAAVLPI